MLVVAIVKVVKAVTAANTRRDVSANIARNCRTERGPALDSLVLAHFPVKKRFQFARLVLNLHCLV